MHMVMIICMQDSGKQSAIKNYFYYIKSIASTEAMLH